MKSITVIVYGDFNLGKSELFSPVHSLCNHSSDISSSPVVLKCLLITDNLARSVLPPAADIQCFVNEGHLADGMIEIKAG